MTGSRDESIRHRVTAWAPWAVPMVLALLLSACGTAGIPRGDELLKGGDPMAAVAAFEEEEAARPDDAELKRNLGVALIEAGRAVAAVDKLKEAAALDPEDPLTQYFLGLAAERSDREEEALAAYNRYLSLTDRGGDVVRARIRAVSAARAEREIRQALRNEAELATVAPPPGTVAVPPYADFTANPDLAPLGRGLAVVLMTDLARVRALRVVERERIDVLLEEIEMGAPAPAGGQAPAVEPPAVSTVPGMKYRLARLRDAEGNPFFTGQVDDVRDAAFAEAVRGFQRSRGLSVDGIPGPRTQAAMEEAFRDLPQETVQEMPPREMVDVSTAPRAGRLLGAGRLVQGRYSSIGAGQLQLGAAVAMVADGSTSNAGMPVQGPVEDVLRLQKDLTIRILEALGVALSDDERRGIEALPTRSFDAFLAYCRGLDYQSRGMGSEALDAFREAVRLDPGFDMAREEEEIAEVTEDDQESLDRARLEEAIRTPNDPIDRLVRTGGWVGLGPGPDLDRGDDIDPAVVPAEKVAEATIVVEGDLPGGGDR